MVVFVAEDALKYRRVPRRDVTVLADVPLITVGTAINREEIVMVPIHVVPITRVVAGQTGGWESRLDVVWVCIVVVIVVATVAIRRGPRVAPGMAGLTTETKMGTVQWECGLIVVKIRWLPAVDGMAIFAGGRESLMVRIRGIVVLALMAGNTVRRRARITVGMTRLAIKGKMCPLQGKGRLVVVETGRFPAINGMAIFASGWESLMVRIRSAVELAFVASDTVRWRA